MTVWLGSSRTGRGRSLMLVVDADLRRHDGEAVANHRKTIRHPGATRLGHSMPKGTGGGLGVSSQT